MFIPLSDRQTKQIAVAISITCMVCFALWRGSYLKPLAVGLSSSAVEDARTGGSRRHVAAALVAPGGRSRRTAPLANNGSLRVKSIRKLSTFYDDDFDVSYFGLVGVQSSGSFVLASVFGNSSTLYGLRVTIVPTAAFNKSDTTNFTIHNEDCAAAFRFSFYYNNVAFRPDGKIAIGSYSDSISHKMVRDVKLIQLSFCPFFHDNFMAANLLSRRNPLPFSTTALFCTKSDCDCFFFSLEFLRS